MTLKEVEPKIIWTLQKKIEQGAFQPELSEEWVTHIMFADTIQKSSIQETTHESSITI